MASIISEFEYDIFISYRQKDNKSGQTGDGWVTKFVDSLKRELETTFKDEVSIYFDINPHDGLHENHAVNESLAGKLKSAVFIPIVSQTFCDPRSFAWEHELMAFITMANTDGPGLKIKLPGGNVSSRILPVRIHELNKEDISLFESATGGVIRPIDFVFKSSGVNRPLLPSDKKTDNQSHIIYRDQINKVANAVKEIIDGMRGIENTTSIQSQESRVQSSEGQVTPPNSKKKFAIIAIIFAMLCMIAYLVIYFNAKEEVRNPTDKSIAVLPFVNMSNDDEQEFFTDGVTEQIITNLAHLNDLKVIARTSVMKFKKTSKTIAEIGKELNVTHILEGSIRKAGNRIRVTAQLIAVHDEANLWAQEYNKDLSDIFAVQDEVSMAIAKSLEKELSPEENESIKSDRSNVEAYEHYLRGFYIHNEYYYLKRLEEDFIKSEMEFKKAIELDSGYAMAYAGLADLYDTKRNFGSKDDEERLKYQNLRDHYSEKGYKLGPNNPYVISVKAYTFSSKADRVEADLDSAFKYQKRAVEIAPNNTVVCDALSSAYFGIGLYHQAVKLRERIIVLDPTVADYHTSLGGLYLNLAEYRKAETTLMKAIKLEPNSLIALGALANLNLYKKDYREVERLIKLRKEINPDANNTFFEAYLLAAKGEREKALALLSSPNHTIYLALGMKNEALDLLEKNYSNWPFLHFQNSFVFNSVRDDPRFKQILEDAKKLYEDRLRRFAN